jgi:ABC-type multidrug transport system fused ATPase/permease subunit
MMGGPLIAVALALLLVLGQGLSIAVNVWLAQWARQTAAQQRDGTGLGVYCGLVVAALVAAVVRSFASFKFALIASQHLHNNMLRCIVRAPLQFFDSNPVGRIINRFAKDIGFADDNLPMTLYDFMQVQSFMYNNKTNSWVPGSTEARF